MARVTSKKTRQAILTSDSPWNPDLTPEGLALFDSAGNPISLTGAGIPVGGTVGQVLVKNTDEDFSATWNDPIATPVGGLEGQVLAKASDDDGDVEWVDQSGGGGSGGGSGGFMGDWLEAVTYPAGAIVKYLDVIFGTTVEIQGMAPDAVPGSDWGVPVRDLQTTTLDKIKNDVPKIVTFGPDMVDQYGRRSRMVAIDFPTSTLTDMLLHVVNSTDEDISIDLFSMAGAEHSGAFPGAQTAGTTVEATLNFTSSIGGSGNYIMQVRSSYINSITGSVELTISGAELTAPDVANPWVPFS